MFRKTSRTGFHESYYDHACLIVTERDVLDTEIRGMSCMASVKRMWYDLFLLSYSDARGGDIYHSSHGMRMDRRRHFIRHRKCIHPLSKFRSYWDNFMLYVVLIHKILLISFTSMIFVPISNVPYLIGVVLEIIMICDIYINTRTGYIDSSKKVELDIDSVLLHYCSRKLFFHVVCSIPYVCIMFLRYGNDINCGICKANNFNCVICFLSAISSFRVYELTLIWKRNKGSVYFHLLRLVVVIIIIIIQFLHWNDTTFLIEIMVTKSLPFSTNSSTFFGNIFRLIHVNGGRTVHWTYIYVHFWRVVNFVARPSYGMTGIPYAEDAYMLVYPHPLLNLTAYALVTACYVSLLFEYFFFITSRGYVDEQIRKNQQYLLNLIKCRQLSDELCADIKYYFKHEAAIIKLVEREHGLFRCLPKTLKNEISWYSYSRLIIGIPHFREWPKEVIEKLVDVMKEQIYVDNDLVSEMGVQGDGLMIVEAGMLAVYSAQNVEMGHLIDGDFFGELSLVTDKEVRTSTVVAVTYCKTILLEKILFRQIMRSYPQLFRSLYTEILNGYQSQSTSN